jgi:predicted site-specific integrase-resolvase
MNENLIGVREASRILGITIPAVHYHILQGRIPVIGKFGNSFILERSHVEAFRAKREQRRGGW